MFVPTDLYARLGMFDSSYAISADYKWMLNAGYKHQVPFRYLPRTFVHMGHGGKSTAGWRSIVTGNLECARAWSELGLRRPLTLIPNKLLYKLLANW